MRKSPYNTAVAVTPNDSTEIPPTAALYVGVAGNLSVVFKNGQTVAFRAAPVGVLPIEVTKVRSTGTAATDIVALYGGDHGG